MRCRTNKDRYPLWIRNSVRIGPEGAEAEGRRFGKPGERESHCALGPVCAKAKESVWGGDVPLNSRWVLFNGCCLTCLTSV